MGAPFTIGSGQQCVTVDLLTGTLTTVYVGRNTLVINVGNARSGSVCGEGRVVR